MKNTYLNFRSAFIFIGITLFFGFSVNAQTLSWSGYPGNTVGANYDIGTAPNNMRAVVTVNAVTRNDGTPKYIATGATSGTPCYIQGLALNAGRFNHYLASTNSHFTVFMEFNRGNVGDIEGTCNSVDFYIRDINSEESWRSFLDVVEISAIRGDGTAVPAANITTTLATRVTRVVSGTTVRLVGHNSSSEIPDSHTGAENCSDTRVVINPGANTPLRSITIKYRPGHGTSEANSYHDLHPRPAVQYISISNIMLNTVGTCPTTLSVELSSFTGESIDRSNLLKWTTATETNNSHFELERSTDGKEWEKIATVNGAGTTTQPQLYSVYDTDFEHTENYYRLRQVDYDGTEKLSDIVVIDNSLRTKVLDKIVNTMGQTVDESYKGMKIYIYTDGTIIKKMD